FDPSQANNGVRSNIPGSATRNIIDNDRHGNTVGNGLEVLVQPFLSRLVVIWRNRQNAVDTPSLDLFGQINYMRSIVAPSATNDWHTMPCLIDDNLDDAQVLFFG